MRAYFDKSVYVVFAGGLFMSFCILIYHGCIHKTLTPDFIAPEKIFAGDTVKFYDHTKNAKSWDWDFGDNSGNSNLQHPLHCYLMEGTFDVTLTVNNAETLVKQVRVVQKQIPVRRVIPAVKWFPSQPKIGEPVRFKDFTPGATAWEWNFGEGNAVSYEREPVYAFTYPGKKEINVQTKGKDFAGEIKLYIEIKKNTEEKTHTPEVTHNETIRDTEVKPDKNYSFKVYQNTLEMHELYPVQIRGDKEFGGDIKVEGNVYLELSTDRKKIFGVVNAAFTESKGKRDTKAIIEGSLNNKILLFTAPSNKKVFSLPRIFSQHFEWEPPSDYHGKKIITYTGIFINKIELIGDTQGYDLPSDGTEDNCRFRIYFDDFDIILMNE